MATKLQSKREKRRSEIKEDIKYLLEEVCDFYPEETFYKNFSRQARKGNQDFIDLSKEKLKDLTYRENNVNICKLEQSEVCKVRILKNYIAYRES